MSGVREADESIKPGAQAPGSRNKNFFGAREVGDSASLLYAVARFVGSGLTSVLILGLAPQALCFRPLRGLSTQTNTFAVDAHPTTP